ncbi:inositol-polyphosphate 5-phosphatase [Cryptococcus deuterogattii 99/473]|uniref:Unplaced genomic scaffold supercont1.1, whole genome shotgun sequence n=1 Tax=Cryptococcus deuterogattii Ram5 TaxID=1296110 RepID=A0A0D0VBX7_9TREE|nr:inositol-polyphosphate 5-phosphatase [Cryptococcus deuterogattii Ram5]KIY54317.1 inositol-polyphosphate 5-phosphatase [Cryptococcus deuterogattii 99/473]
MPRPRTLQPLCARQRSPCTPEDGKQPEILYIIPIIPSFKHNLEQTPPSPSTSFFHQSAKPHITLYLSCEDTAVELRIAANQSAKVQKFVTELRKYSDLANNTLYPSSLTHAWIDLYPVNSPADENADAAEELSVDSSKVIVVDHGEKTENTPTVTPSASHATLTPATPPSEAPSLAPPIPTSKSPKHEVNTTITKQAEDPQPNPYLPTFSRTSFLRSRLFSSLPSWSSSIPIKIRTVSYNVNDKVPPKGTLELKGLVGGDDEETSDLIVVGLQEADLRSQALLISQGNSRADSWEVALFAGLGDKAGEYEKLIMTQYVGVVMIILVRKTLRPHISRVENSERGIGLLGFGGNKAGVAVRLKVHDTTLCFVNCHMAAFTSALDRRRQDYQILRSGLTFPRPLSSASLTSAPLSSSSAASISIPPISSASSASSGTLASGVGTGTAAGAGTMSTGGTKEEKTKSDGEGETINPVFEEFWPEVKDKLLTLEDCHLLLKNDIKEGKSFVGFEEAEITFPPRSAWRGGGLERNSTFKYVHGSSTLDTKRSPAYTDRILYSFPCPTSTSPTPLSPCVPVSINKEKYTSHEELKWSDHRPVSCVFEVGVRKVDVEKRREGSRRAQKELDRLEEVWRPSLEIKVLPVSRDANEKANADEKEEAQEEDVGGIHFGKVRCREKKERKVRLKNGGKVPVSWNFRQAGIGRDICKPFLWPFPSSGTVEPDGEMVLTIVLDVNEEWAAKLTLGEEDGNDVLVLQVEGGKDTFITVQSIFLPSIISLPLTFLSALPSPIRDMSLSERKSLFRSLFETAEKQPAADNENENENEAAISGPTPFKPVKEIWTLLEYLMANPPSLSTWCRPSLYTSSFSSSATSAGIQTIMEHLNSLPSTTPLPPDVPHLIPPTLIYLLSSIPGGLLPESVQEQIEQKGVEDRDAAFGVLEGVKMVSTNTLIGMISVVRLCLGDGMGAQQGGAKIEEEADGREHVVEGGGRKVDKPNRNSSISEGGVNSTFHVAIPSTPESSTKVSRNSADLPPSHSNAENNANLESVLESRDDTANLELEGGALFELGDDEDDDDEGEVKEDAEDEEVVKDEDENEEESDNVPEIEKESKDALDAVKKDAEEEKNDAEEKKKNVKTKDEPTSSFDGASLPITEPKAEPALQPAAELTPSKPRPKTKRAKSLAEEFLGEASLIENDVGGDDNDNSIERTSEKVKIGDVTMDQVEKVDGQTLETPKAPSRLPAGTGGANGATKEEEVCTIDKLVDVLCPAVFGRVYVSAVGKERRRKFIKLLLEG